MNDEEKHPKRKEAFYSLGSNVLLAILKFAAADFTGSSVLFSEGVHSIVNASGAVSMLVGRRQSMRPVDESHPFGHGKELYFWTLIVGVTIFAVASTLIFFESFFKISSQEPMRNVPFAFIVLGISALLEAIGTISALHAFRTYINEKGGENLSFIEAIKENRNQFTLTILFEHGVSLAGIVVAFFAVFFSEILRKPVLDPIGSIIIAFMLSATAVFLIAESRAFLIGERAMKHMLENVNKIASKDPNIERVENIRTMHFGPEEALLSLNLRLRPDLGSEELGETIRDLRKRIQKENPEFKNILIDSDSLAMQAEGKRS